MRYVSTRGAAPVLDFEGVVLAGLAEDGGLYLPETWPQLDEAELRDLAGRSYQEIATRVMAPFVAPSLSVDELRVLVDEAYATFDHAEVAPLRQLGGQTYLLELFHGPTLAFKDVALQLLGRLFDHFVGKRGGRVTVLGATSGDTGSAAIAGCRGRDALDIFILHPHERTSEVQRRQMTTVLDDNVHNLALEGTFDDCQDLVKAMFRDPVAREELGLTAVNSINWARVLAQIVYYFTAALALGAPDRRVRFVVPTGNFGDVFAGWCAQRMGLPIERLVIATNTNDILARTLHTGSYTKSGVHPTLSPSMDIQISSNFERLLFEAYGRDADAVRGLMEQLATEGRFTLSESAWRSIRQVFLAHTTDDAATLRCIAQTHADNGVCVDPHTAVGLAAAHALEAPADVAVCVLATAHPAKFPDAVEEATGEVPALPERLADLWSRPERYEVVQARREAVEAIVRARARVLAG